MARLPYVDPQQASQDVRDTLEQLPLPLNIFKMMAHASTSFRPLVRLGTAILGQQQLDAKLRELCILRVAALSPARYEWTQHVPIAKAFGVDAAQIEALERGDIGAQCFSPIEQSVLNFATDLVGNARASDAVFAAVQQHLSPREIVELILVVGYYMMIARLLETTAVDMEAAAGTAIVDAAQKARR